MSKRFFNSYFTEHIIDKKTDKCYPVRYVEGVYELTDLLNELSEENEKLKHYNLYEDNKRLQTIIADLKEENDQLRQEIIVYKKAFQQQVQRCTL